MEDWIPAALAWAAFCKTPQGQALGLIGNQNSWIWFHRTHGAEMVKRGVLVKAHTRRLLAHSTKFAPAAFELLTGILTEEVQS